MNPKPQAICLHASLHIMHHVPSASCAIIITHHITYTRWLLRALIVSQSMFLFADEVNVQTVSSSRDGDDDGDDMMASSSSSSSSSASSHLCLLQVRVGSTLVALGENPNGHTPSITSCFEFHSASLPLKNTLLLSLYTSNTIPKP